jgi:hypothetical protein
MYDGWKKNGTNTDKWWDKTNDFIERAFSLAITEKIKCLCVKCQNRGVLTRSHLVRNGFASDYEMWVLHGEKYTTIITEESGNDRAGADRMDEILKLYGQSLTWILPSTMSHVLL